MFSSVAVPFYITPLSMRVPISPHVHQQLLFSILFVYLFVNNSHPDGYEVAFHSGFDFSLIQFSYSVMSDSVTPWTTAHQASLSITNSQSLLKLMSIETVMPSNHFILCCPLLLLLSIFPSTKVFSNESVLCIRWPKIGVSASTSVLLMSIQDWFPLGWTGWISLQSKGLSRVFSNTTVQKHQFFSAQLSL